MTVPTFSLSPYRTLILTLISVLFFISANPLAYGAKVEMVKGYKSAVPKIDTFNLDPQKIASIVNDKQMILTHKPISIMAPGKKGLKEFKDATFVTSIMRINKPAQEVRDIVLDLTKYKEFVPHTITSDVIMEENNLQIAHTVAEVKTPIIKLKEKVKLQYSLEEDGDITMIMLDGFVDASISRWQFIEINKAQTLAVYTSWTDLKSATFLVRSILRADPDLNRVAPIALGAVVIEEFKKRAEGEPPKPKIDDMPVKTVLPVFAKTSDIPIDTLRQLSEIGTLLFVHKAQWVNTEDGPQEFIYVTSGKVINVPKEYNIARSIRFDRYHEFFKHVKKNKLISPNQNLREETFDVKWHLKVGLGFAKISIKYDMRYEWTDPNSLYFVRTKGDIQYIEGVWEYINIEPDKTLMLNTALSKVGKKGSFLIKIANSIPNFEMMTTIIAQALIVEKQKPWIEQQYLEES